MTSRIPSLICTLGAIAVFSLPCTAQKDTVEFKFIPRYYPEQDAQYTELPPPEIVSQPAIEFPADPELKGTVAKVWVNILIDAKGTARDAKVLKSTDHRFDRYALRYAKQYKFRWPDPKAVSKPVWVALPIRFTP
jgi:TonB family protein